MGYCEAQAEKLLCIGALFLALGKRLAKDRRQSINDAIKSTSEQVDRYNADLDDTPSNN